MHNDIKTEHYAMLHVQHSGEGLGVIPVSYTHLDVYKRQKQAKVIHAFCQHLVIRK